MSRKEKITDLDKFATKNFLQPYGDPRSEEFKPVLNEHCICTVWALIKEYPEWAEQAIQRARRIWPQGKTIRFPTYVEHPFVGWFMDELRKETANETY